MAKMTHVAIVAEQPVPGRRFHRLRQSDEQVALEVGGGNGIILRTGNA